MGVLGLVQEIPLNNFLVSKLESTEEGNSVSNSQDIYGKLHLFLIYVLYKKQ